MNNTTLHSKLRLARLQRGLTIRQVGQLIDAAESLVCMWESGKRNPSADTLRKYVRAGFITPAEAMGVDDSAA